MTGYLAATFVAVLGGPLVQVHLILFIENVFEASEFLFWSFNVNVWDWTVVIAP